MNRILKISLFLFMFLFPISCFGEGKPCIKVSFHIQEQMYRAFYGPDEAELSKIEEKAAERIASILDREIGFLDFTLNADRYNLKISLDVKEQMSSTSHLREVGFRFNLEDSNNSGRSDTVYWKFRSAEDYNAPLWNEDGFLDAISSCFKMNLKNPDSLTRNLFCNIIIADKAFHFPKSPKLILPFTCDDSGIGLNSMFKVITKYNESGMIIFGFCITKAIGYTGKSSSEIPAEYLKGKIVTKAVKPADEVRKMTDNGEITAKEIYLQKYIPLPKKNSNLETAPDSLTLKKNEEP
ncbi:MAG: hypothetical protein GTO45_31400 [Candidatus Aminicenantes bacterium]|nr:hypothetical protein [Candidatus Aminicenantes bacterium]NIM83315.1 hypothetical protein [Candidatus Aminicenantes bacterium]NIN22674.1 hypothetical protein [Candidatus Aminicenantes bacterium]NIN46434.1 hypothetical protein [Candidatus Aminicenantes bacterium]NIN89286.1 hypothetical protein [Candidatus Aminicenantes bacterium]